jgi:glycosyltransferase involved in cell wall biosynthesis
MNSRELNDKADYDAVAQRVLVLGPDYRNHFGGIGSVLESYSRLFSSFSFYPTYKNGPFFFRLFFSIKQIAFFPFFLATHPKFRILHIHGSSYGSFYRKYLFFLIGKHLFRLKTIYHVHGSEYQQFCNQAGWLTKKSLKHFIEKTDLLVCLSESWKKFFQHRYPKANIEVLVNYIELIPKTKIDFEPNKPTVFLFLGKIGDRKGTFDILEAVSNMAKAERENFEVWIAGDGEIERLKKEIEKRNLRKKVKYLGWISGTSKEEKLSRADIYVLPSYNEGMPISILEAMAHGLPIISTHVGGIPELVADGHSGLLINPGDVPALQDAMEYLLNNTKARLNMGRNASTQIAEKFSAEINIPRIHKLYQDLASSPKKHPKKIA